MSAIKIADITAGKHAPLVLISGPCVIEDIATAQQTCKALADMTQKLGMPFIFKSSYEKDNRSSIHSYHGPGLEEGLAVLAKIKDEFGVLVTSDVHRPEDVAMAAEVLDLIQIPSFLCQQTSLLVAAGKSGKPINIKKGQFMSAVRMAGPLEKVKETGNANVMITERGTTFGDASLVSDARTISKLQALGCPVCFDASHMTRLFGAKHYGESEQIPVLARAAVAAGCDALFIETHPEPEKAASDSGTMARLADMPEILKQACELGKLVRSWK